MVKLGKFIHILFPLFLTDKKPSEDIFIEKGTLRYRIDYIGASHDKMGSLLITSWDASNNMIYINKNSLFKIEKRDLIRLVFVLD